MEDSTRGGARRTFAASLLTAVVVGLFFVPRAIDAKQSGNADIVAIQTAIETGNRAYLAALKERDATRFAALFAEDAISLPPTGEPIHGRENIRESISSAFDRVTFLDGSMHTLELQVAPNSAVEIGSYRFAILTDGVPEQLHGRYVTMWRLVHGAWKIAVDSSQPDAPVPEPVGTMAPAVPIDASPVPDPTASPAP